jgi:hypothetical protein
MELAAIVPPLWADGSCRCRMTDLDDRMLGYLLWLLVGLIIGVCAAPTVSEAKARLLGRLRDLDAVAPWPDEDQTDRDEERR